MKTSLKISAFITDVMTALRDYFSNVIPKKEKPTIPAKRRDLLNEEDKKVQKNICIECNGTLKSEMIENSYVRWTCTDCGSVYEQYFPYGRIYLMPPEPVPLV